MEPSKEQNRLLAVSVVSARGLKAMDISGASDPYVSFSVGGGKHGDRRRAQSKVVSKTLNPEFNEEVKIRLSEKELAGEDLLVQVWDHDTFSLDDLIGEVTIPLANLNPQPKWYLICKAGASTGEVRLGFNLALPTLQLPPETERIKEGLLEKKVLGRSGIGRWEQRTALFTKTLLFLAKPGEDKVLDCVPLDEIDTVVLVQLQSEADRKVHADREAAPATTQPLKR